MPEVCAQHPAAPATYRCDGCRRALCDACIKESHVLVLCGVCGEMAVPIGAGEATAAPSGGPPVAAATGATVRDRRRQAAITRPYPLTRALGYPLRGSGLGMFVATLATLGFLWFIRHGWGCLPILLTLGFTGMVVALQFKIVRTTAAGDDDLPDWPDFLDIRMMILDYLTWIGVQLHQLLLVVPFFVLRYHTPEALLEPPSYPFWLGVAVLLWLGGALALMAFGAAGVFGRPYVLAVPSHVRGFLAAGGSAIKIANVGFGVGAVVLMVQFLLESNVPWVGAALSTGVSVYWIFTAPHLAGVLFRRHLPAFEKIYGAQA